jgi:transposase
MQPHKYDIRLSGQEKQALRQLMRDGKTERRLADRARIILWTAAWMAVDTIAQRLEIHHDTVITWRQRYLEGRQAQLCPLDRLRDRPRSGRPTRFSASQVAQLKAVACEKPSELNLPLTRFSLAEIVRWIEQAAVMPAISRSSVWRILHHAAIRPWYYRGWLFPRDPAFVAKAERILDLYQRHWQDEPLGPDDYVISADEKSGLQVLARPHPTQPPSPGQGGRYEFEYVRHGTLAYLAALDVFSGHIFGRIADTTGVEPFGCLVDQVMRQEPYQAARRVFWIVDGGSSHHPSTAAARLQACYPNIIVVHTPTHASWLNQIEIYFSILQRKALTPMDAADRLQLAERILCYQEYYNQTAKPFNWKFTRSDLQQRLRTLTDAKSENL